MVRVLFSSLLALRHRVMANAFEKLRNVSRIDVWLAISSSLLFASRFVLLSYSKSVNILREMVRY